MKRRQIIKFVGAMSLSPLFSAHIIQSTPNTDRRPFLIEAHRGNSITMPENTIVAIEQAVHLGVDRVEIDLEFSSDGKLVIMHDPTVDRTTNGTGKVSELSWDELEHLDAGSWKSEDFCGAKIPLLEEVLILCRDKTMVNIDLKNENAVPEMVSLIKKMKMEDQVVITGIIPRCTRSIREAGANLTMFYDEPTPAFNGLYLQGKFIEAIHQVVSEARYYCLPGLLFQASWITEEIVHIAHLHGLSVNVYAVDTPDITKSMLEAGVDSVMTDDPEMVKQTLQYLINKL